MERVGCSCIALMTLPAGAGVPRSCATSWPNFTRQTAIVSWKPRMTSCISGVEVIVPPMMATGTMLRGPYSFNIES